jgi:hypothetical protein
MTAFDREKIIQAAIAKIAALPKSPAEPVLTIHEAALRSWRGHIDRIRGEMRCYHWSSGQRAMMLRHMQSARRTIAEIKALQVREGRAA